MRARVRAATKQWNDGAQLASSPPLSGDSISLRSNRRSIAVRPGSIVAVASCFASRRICTRLLTRCCAGVTRPEMCY